MKNCPPMRSEIKLMVNSQPKADAGADQRLCPGSPVMLHGKVKGKAADCMVCEWHRQV